MRVAALLTIVFASWPLAGFAQQPAVDDSILQCRKGDYAGAMAGLERLAKANSLDAEVWTCLAFAQIEKGDRAARRSTDKASQLSSNSTSLANVALAYLLLRQPGAARAVATVALERGGNESTALFLRGSAYLQENKLDRAEEDANAALNAQAVDPRAYLLKSRIVLERVGRDILKGKGKGDKTALQEILELLGEGLKKSKNHWAHTAIQAEYETIASFQEYFSRSGISPNDVDDQPDAGVTPLKILSKPRPGYTDEARMRNVQGTIRVLVIFGASGRVEKTFLLNRLGSGIDQQVIAAVNRISFTPMMRDGKPVSTVKQIEYTFSIY